MTLSSLALALFGFALGTRAADAQTPPEPPPPPGAARPGTITVSGLGRVSVTPDRVVFSASVQTMGALLPPALDENNTRVAAVIAALKKLGVTDRQIRSSHVSIVPQMDYQPRKQPRITGYQVSNGVTVTRDDPSGVGQLLQAAIDAGANQVSGISFTVADPQRGRDEGLQKAFADARAKAETLARAAGRTVGRAVSITEGEEADAPRPIRYKMASQESDEVPVEAGVQELTFTVSVVFELQ